MKLAALKRECSQVTSKIKCSQGREGKPRKREGESNNQK